MAGQHATLSLLAFILKRAQKNIEHCLKWPQDSPSSMEEFIQLYSEALSKVSTPTFTSRTVSGINQSDNSFFTVATDFTGRDVHCFKVAVAVKKEKRHGGTGLSRREGRRSGYQ